LFVLKQIFRICLNPHLFHTTRGITSVTIILILVLVADRIDVDSLEIGIVENLADPSI
jgi:hypothetical protein